MTTFGKVFAATLIIISLGLTGVFMWDIAHSSVPQTATVVAKTQPVMTHPIITEEMINEHRIYGTDVSTYIKTKGIHPDKDSRFNRRYIYVAELRTADYGVSKTKSIPLFVHKGGKRIEKDVIYGVLEAVVQRMPNLKTTPELLDFGYRTLLIETGCGSANYNGAVKRYKNYGIAQFRIDSAEETLWWLKQVRKDVHTAVMELYDKKKSMKENLMENVPFSVALMYQYYWRRVANFQNEIDCIKAQGVLYKAHYNSPLGLGTIHAWMSRLEAFNKLGVL